MQTASTGQQNTHTPHTVGLRHCRNALHTRKLALPRVANWLMNSSVRTVHILLVFSFLCFSSIRFTFAFCSSFVLFVLLCFHKLYINIFFSVPLLPTSLQIYLSFSPSFFLLSHFVPPICNTSPLRAHHSLINSKAEEISIGNDILTLSYSYSDWVSFVA